MVETKIFAHLSTSTNVTAIAASRIYPLILPQTPTLPAITYQRVAGTRENDITHGYVTLENVIIQIDVWSTSFDVMADLATKVTNAMCAATAYSCLALTSPIDFYEDDIFAFRRSMDFSIWNRE